jgi:hypothetical protein
VFDFVRALLDSFEAGVARIVLDLPVRGRTGQHDPRARPALDLASL